MRRRSIVHTPALTEHPRAREVRRLENHRVAFLGHLVAWGSVLLLLLVTAGAYPALVVALAWGIGLACHGFFAVVAPELRRRWTEADVARSVGTSVVDERRLAEGRHARSLQDLSASIAHEIRNPITAAKSLVQQMRDDPASTDHDEYARIAIEELDRVERSVSHLLRYARDEETVLEDLDLGDVVEPALELISERLGRSKARLERDVDFGATMRGDPEQLRRVVGNLVGNALDALEATEEPDPFVRISVGRSLDLTEVWLRVTDNGKGIEPARLTDIWNPFYTSKKSGTGLGLAITKKIVEAHGGRIEAVAARAGGAEIVATFPSRGEGAP